MEADRVILEPLTTEKAERLRETQNVVAFRVSPKANKIQIRRAVERLFEVEVKDVRTSNFTGKNKRWGRFVGRRPNWKKAYVTLQEGHSIEIFKGV
ncbi:MAG: 50S ribosomal protein L23 [Acidobacteriota bacterium]|nr:50S ribosomal protein L23 [Acidobacteriota bacterium]MDE3262539.1 50S ribosomal protein L23 [Acidobacteriota bacterium]